MSSTRTAQEARLMVAANEAARFRFDEPVPEHTPAFTLERQIAQARQEMGPERWAQLNREWSQSE